MGPCRLPIAIGLIWYVKLLEVYDGGAIVSISFYYAGS